MTVSKDFDHAVVQVQIVRSRYEFKSSHGSTLSSEVTMPLKSFIAVMIVVLGLSATSAEGAPIFVAGPSPVAPFGGTVIDFEGQAEGTLIDTEYSGLGVTFTQDDSGTPMIDNLPALFGYGPGSGTGMLTGSTTGGAQFPTVAGLVAEFSTPQAQV